MNILSWELSESGALLCPKKKTDKLLMFPDFDFDCGKELFILLH